MDDHVERAGFTFVWNTDKAKSNLHKHGVSFDEAIEVLLDRFAKYAPDEYSVEDRMIAVGQTHKRRLLVVVHVERGAATRIISAREAEHAEQKAYESDDRSNR